MRSHKESEGRDNVKAFVDGNMVGLVNDDFKDLQQSDVVWVERCDLPRPYEPIIDELRFIRTLCNHEEKVGGEKRCP